MFKKFATAAAISALVVASAASANAAKLSLTRASTTAEKDNELVPGVIAALAIVGVIGVLEVTGAINIIGDDSDSN